MIRFILLASLALLLLSPLYGQNRVIPNKPYSILSSRPGYILNNEFVVGIGLGDTGTPMSGSFVGATSTQGYQINRTFVIGGGTGMLFYDGGMMIPLDGSIRSRLGVALLTPYLNGNGGILVGFNDAGSSMFINPEAGVRYTLNNNLAFTLGAGLWVQEGKSRNSFATMKLGVTFKPE
jgi:hypothetical protein